MKNIFLTAAIAALSASDSLAQIVYDPANHIVSIQQYETAKEISALTTSILETDQSILDTNDQILETVNEIRDSIQGERSEAVEPMANTAVQEDFNVAVGVSVQEALADGVEGFELTTETGSGLGDAANGFLFSLNLNKSLSEQGELEPEAPDDEWEGEGEDGEEEDEEEDDSNDASYQELLKTIAATQVLIKGSQQAAADRKEAFEAASAEIGKAQDVKGSIDQNTQVQAEVGLTINEMIGVLNGAVASLQAQNQREATVLSNTSKALHYGE